MDYLMNKQTEITKNEKKWLDDSYLSRQQQGLPEDAPRVAALYRVSTKGQVEEDEIPMQKIECRKFCATHGWRIVLEEHEKGVSGWKVSANDRDAISRLKKAAQQKEIDILLVYMADRLGRIAQETPFVVKWFAQHGVKVWSTREGVQTMETHNDEFLRYVQYWMAEGEAQKTAERVRTSIRQKNSNGEYTGGGIAYGYTTIKDRVNKHGQRIGSLVICPEEAKLVKLAFDLMAKQGLSSYAIAKRFNEEGYTTRGGAKWQGTNIQRMIRHEGYTGYFITCGARSDFIPDLKIIEKDLFDEANKILECRAAKNAENRRVAQKSGNETLLAGMVYCAHCGARMSGFIHLDRYKLADGTIKETHKPKYNCFQRAQGYRECDGQALYLAERVDAVVLNTICDLMKKMKRTPKNQTLERQLKAAAKEHRKQQRPLEQKVKRLEEELRRLEGEVLKSLSGNSDFTPDLLSKLLKGKEQELQEARLAYAKACNSAQSVREELRQVEKYYAEFLGWANEFDLAPIDRKKMILSKLVDKVEVGRGYEIKIHLNMSYQQFVEIQQEVKNSNGSDRN